MNKSDLDFVNSKAKIKNRVAVDSYYFETLPKALKEMAFTVSNLETLSMVKMIQRSLENAQRKGMSFDSWKKSLNQDTLRSLSRSRLETVYRTNLSSVYNVSTRMNAATTEATPYLMYSAVGDSRTRQSHQELDGVIKKASDPFWNTHTPPLGYNCRCSIIPISKEEAKSRGISRGPVDFEPDTGFGNYESLGDVNSGVSGALSDELAEMPHGSPFKQKILSKIASTESLVDVWWQKNKNLFEV